jgi:hypothetical protein
MNFRETLKSLFDRKDPSLLLFWMVVVLGSVLGVIIGDRYGSFYGGLFAIVIVPLIATRIIRGSRTGKHGH